MEEPVAQSLECQTSMWTILVQNSLLQWKKLFSLTGFWLNKKDKITKKGTPKERASGLVVWKSTLDVGDPGSNPLMRGEK